MMFCEDGEDWPRCGSPDEGAQIGLAGLMSGISEDLWCAGWLMGNEYALWQAKPGQRYGMGEITERQATLLRLLSEEADGWFRWDDERGLVFVRMKAWLAHLDAKKLTGSLAPKTPTGESA